MIAPGDCNRFVKKLRSLVSIRVWRGKTIDLDDRQDVYTRWRCIFAVRHR